LKNIFGRISELKSKFHSSGAFFSLYCQWKKATPILTNADETKEVVTNIGLLIEVQLTEEVLFALK